MNIKRYARAWAGCRFVLPVLLLGTGMASLHAQGLQKPAGPVLLRISGHISQRNAGDTAVFDAAMLNALPPGQIITRTPWHPTPAQFAGPALKTLLQAVGASGKVLHLTALDKYEVNIPMEDLNSFGPLLALRMDGKELTIRSRGPVLLMYPFDTYSQIDTDVYYGRSVWQLIHIVVE